MDAKLHIDLAQQTLQVEGSEEFVREIYGDFKDRLSTLGQEVQSKTKRTIKSKIAQPPSGIRKSRTAKETHILVKELDLAAKGDKPSLKDFFARYKTSSNFERNLIFVYYLQNIVKVTPITSNHIFTCYRDVGTRVPGAFNQSLRDTASQKGWIDTSSLDDIKLTTQGINYIELDMAKAG